MRVRLPRYRLLLFTLTASLVPAAVWSAAREQATAPPPDKAWHFRQSEVTGGGLATEIAVSPSRSRQATVGGDSWGLYNTSNAGDEWLPAMKSSDTALMTGDNGTFYYSGLAYSKDPNRPDVVYGLLGRCGKADGGFVVVKGDTVQSIDTSGPQGGEPGCDRTIHPRPTGNRVVVDWDGSKEYIYVAGGASVPKGPTGTPGVWRLESGEKHFTRIALGKENPVITGMALVPGHPDELIVTTNGDHQPTLYVLSNIRSSPDQVQPKPVNVDNGVQFEEVVGLGDKLYAAARHHGVYVAKTATLEDLLTSWTAMSNGIPSTVDVVTVGGSASGSRVFAGCVQKSKTPPDSASDSTPGCIYRTTNHAQSWQAVAQPNAVCFREWGSGQTWWHSVSSARAMIDGPSYITSQIAVDAKDEKLVYVAGRAGVWKSEDGGDHWRPAVVGLGGTMHSNIHLVGTDHLQTDDADFCFENSAVSDHFLDSEKITSPGKDCPVPQCETSQSQLTTTLNGVKIEVKPPSVSPVTGKNMPAQFLVGGHDKADEWFKAQVIKPRWVLATPDGYVYIVQCGGGVVLAHQGPFPVVPGGMCPAGKGLTPS